MCAGVVSVSVCIFVCLSNWPSATYSYKKVNHKKYIECEIDLLSNVVTPLLASFDFFARCINKVYNEGCNAEYKYENDLQMKIENELKFRMVTSHFKVYQLFFNNSL